MDKPSRHSFELDHRYGERVHILQDPLGAALLARLCAAETVQPQFNRLVAALYRQLIWHAVRAELPQRTVSQPTRMAQSEPRAIWHGDVIDPEVKVAVLCIARAGIFPSQVCYEFLNEILMPERVRQDHLLMNRTTDDGGRVQGVAIHGAKIGGSVDQRVLFVPDPMGATGSTVSALLAHYASEVPGTPRSVVALNLIVTPEYLRRLTQEHPTLNIYALRLDRGLSSPEVLSAIPGERWDEERGLDQHSYIIPGGGGFGELMNNAFV